MAGPGEGSDQKQAAEIYDSGKDEGVSPSSSPATEKVASPPGYDCSHSESGGHELRRCGHVRRG